MSKDKKEESISQEADRMIKERTVNIKREVAIELWEKYARGAKTLSDLLNLASSEAIFKEFQNELPMAFSNASKTKRSGSTGTTRVRVGDDEVEALRKAFVAAKATSEASAVSKAVILKKADNPQLEKRWLSVSKRLDIGKGGGKKRNQVIWLKTPVK